MIGVRRRARHLHAEQLLRHVLDRAGFVVIVQPLPAHEEPAEEELCGKRGDGEIQPLDPQARQSEQHADGGGEEAGQQDVNEDGDLGKDRRQLVAAISAHPHERAGAERQLPAIAGQNVQPDRRQRKDQERDHDRVDEPVGRQQRHADDGDGQDQPQPDPVLQDRKDGLVGLVGRLELTCFAVEHLVDFPRSAEFDASRSPTKTQSVQTLREHRSAMDLII